MVQFIKKVTTKKFFVKVKSEEEAWKIVKDKGFDNSRVALDLQKFYLKHQN